MSNRDIESLRTNLLEQVRLLAAANGYDEVRQFGGNSFLLNGNMVCCVGKHGLMARVGKEQEPKALEHEHARPFDVTGRKMGGLIIIDFAGLTTLEDIAFWIAMAEKNVGAMPPKEKKKKAS